IPGGLSRTDDPAEQETVLVHQVYKLIYTLAKRDIPLTLLHFPRLIYDPGYLYGKLQFLLAGVPYERFLEKFEAVVQPELVHNFANVAAGNPPSDINVEEFEFFK